MGAKHITDEERAEIVRLAKDEDRNVSEIARIVGRERQTVAKVLACFKSTTKVAKAYAEAESLTLMRRVVKESNVDQALEVLDRTEALPKKRDTATGHSQVIVCVGMPGQPALSPPSQEQIVTVQQRQLEAKS